MKLFARLIFTLIIALSLKTQASTISSIYGYIEPITLLPSHTILPAKMDTGAGVTSLSGQNITYSDTTPQTISFDVIDKKNKINQHFSNIPVIGRIKIKNRTSEMQPHEKNKHSDKIIYSERPMITIDVCFDGQPTSLDVNLTNRSHFDYPILIGRKDLIHLHAIVDPTKKNLSHAQCILEPESKKASA